MASRSAADELPRLKTKTMGARGLTKKYPSTQSTKNHKFEPFSQRIARLTINPIRKRENQITHDSDNEASYFITAIEKWKDANLSENFTAFVRKVDSLCQSLPQVVLYEQDIISLLFEYIEKADPLSLEPLLNLITQLALDLGPRYENHFQRTVETIVHLAANHENVEVIEWAFSCLAWLFKYLSRLLVPDLRPLYNLMAPYLGKARHKSFISRFSAESMSFLVRKAGAQYRKDDRALLKIIEHSFEDLSSVLEPSNKSQYQSGLVVLFSEAIKGIQNSTHSSGASIVHALLKHLDDLSAGSDSAAFDLSVVIEGIFIDLMHYTDAVGFEPILQLFVSFPAPRTQCLRYYARLLLVVCGTRRGSRINSWSSTISRLLYLFGVLTGDQPNPNVAATRYILCASAAVLQYAPLAIASSFGENILQSFEHLSLLPSFLPFCSMLAQMGQERFDLLILPQFKQFITINWATYGLHVCAFASTSILQKTFDNGLRIPEEWSREIVQNFGKLAHPLEAEQDKPFSSLCQGYLNLLKHMPKDFEIRNKVAELILNTIEVILSNGEDYDSSLRTFILCNGFEFAASQKSLLPNLQVDVSFLFKAVHIYGQRVAFLNALVDMLLDAPNTKSPEQLDLSAVSNSLIENLAAPSHELRLVTLRTFSALYAAQMIEEPTILSIARSIEDTPCTAEKVRDISLNIRRFSSLYRDPNLDHWMQQAIPAYCFGVLHKRLTPVWEDACHALRDMAAHHDSETFIADRAVSWTRISSDLPGVRPGSEFGQTSLDADQLATTRSGILQLFQCSNLARLDEMAAAHFTGTFNAVDALDQQKKVVSAPEQLISENNRSQGLRILSVMPEAAERNSRPLVTILLDRAGISSSSNYTEVGINPSPAKDFQGQHNWSRKDLKALLALFEQFKNPSGMFRMKDVYQALKELLCSGDNEIQKSSLKALLAWKQSFLTPYQDNLFNLLDDARFREEITVFLDSENPSGIRPEHLTELMPILLRLLYGRIVTRAGLGGPHATQEAKRKAVFVGISRLGQNWIEEFVSIALGPLDGLSGSVMSSEELHRTLQTDDLIPLRKQAGMVRLLKDMITTLANQLFSCSHSIATAVLYCLLQVNTQLSSPETEAVELKQRDSLRKSIRQDGLTCLTLLYAKCLDTKWMDPIRPILFSSVINPRVETLVAETSHGIPGILKLFAVWAASVETTHLLLEPNPNLLYKVSECLLNNSASLEVKRFVLREILKKFVDTTIFFNEAKAVSVLSNGLAQTFLSRVSDLLASVSEKDVIETGIELSIALQPSIQGLKDAQALMALVLELLSRPSKQVSLRMKGQLLDLLHPLISAYDWAGDQKLYISVVQSVSKLFSLFNDGINRSRAVAIFKALSEQSKDLEESSAICEQLNSFSDSRLNEPNFDDRENGFQRLNDDLSLGLTGIQWVPIIHNLLHMIRDQEELSTRSNASLGLRRFVECWKVAPTEQSGGLDLQTVLEEIILPAVRLGMREPSDLIRLEYINLLGHIISSSYDPLSDMRCLLGPDDESSFFNNVAHIQPHRRLRALQRLANESPNLSSVNISRFCLPLLDDFLKNKEGDNHNLAQAATTTLEQLASGLDWHKFRSLLQRKIQDPTVFESKAQIRILGALITGLHNANEKKRVSKKEETHDDGDIEEMLDSQSLNNLSKTLPTEQTLYKSLSNSILSKLMEQIHYQNEASLEVRILVATYLVKLILVFPEDRTQELLPAVLMDVCNILKSKSQEARDSTRKTLSDIVSIIGPQYFGFVVKQLRTALKRGSQLHVLSFTLHSLLISISSTFEVGSIDYCLSDIVSIVMDDSFGVVGEDKEATGYISSMKEVRRKGSGLDSVEILATMIRLSKVVTMLNPVSAQLKRKRPKIEKIDELLRKIREGLRRNPHANSRDILTLSFELLKENQPMESSKVEMDLRCHKLTVFALELLRRVLDKHENLKTSQNLGGFMPMFAKLSVVNDEQIQISLFRLLASIIKVPMTELDECAGKFIHNARRAIENATSTNEPLAQAALRFSSAIIRERPEATISQTSFETDIAFLLTKIKPDIQEPGISEERDRQIAAFNFLKAIMGRGVVVMEMYDIMNTVREVMLRSQDAPIPELSRSVYARFILEYFPGQGKGLARQLEFLITNLQYEHARGRKSIMEVMGFILGKMDPEDVQPALMSFFLPLALVLIVDQDLDCRGAAEALLHKIFERADGERIEIFKSQMLKWQEPSSNIVWRKTGLRLWAVYLTEHPDATREANAVARYVRSAIESSAVGGEEEQAGAGAAPDTSEELIFASLDVFRCFCNHFPGIAFGENSSATWSAISSHTASEDPRVRASAAELLSLYLADFARTATRSSKPLKLPMTGSYGLKLTHQNALAVISSGMALLESDSNPAEAIEKTVKNLAFIGRVSSADAEAQPTKENNSAELQILSKLISEASTILRADIDTFHPPRGKFACLKLVSALYKAGSQAQLLPETQEVLVPLHHLTDTAVTAPSSRHPDFKQVYEEMVSLAHEVVEQIREKLGSEVFVKEMTAVQRMIRQRREDRKAKRAFEVVAEPEKAERRKRRKRIKDKQKRGEKNQLAASKRRGW